MNPNDQTQSSAVDIQELQRTEEETQTVADAILERTTECQNRIQSLTQVSESHTSSHRETLAELQGLRVELRNLKEELRQIMDSRSSVQSISSEPQTNPESIELNVSPSTNPESTPEAVITTTLENAEVDRSDRKTVLNRRPYRL